MSPARDNNIEAFNNQTGYQTFNDFINYINNPQQYDKMPTCFY